MKTYVHLWQYLAQFFIEWAMLSDKVAQKIKEHNFVFHNVLFKIVQLYLFTSGLKSKILYASFLWPALTMCPAHDMIFPAIYKFPVISLVVLSFLFFNFVPVIWFLAHRLNLPILPATTNSHAVVPSDGHTVPRPVSSSVLICRNFTSKHRTILVNRVRVGESPINETMLCEGVAFSESAVGANA